MRWIHFIFCTFIFLSMAQNAIAESKKEDEKYFDVVIDLDDFMVYSGPKLETLKKDPANDKVEFYFTRMDDLTKELSFEFPDKDPNAKPREKERYEEDPDFVESIGRRWKVATGAREFLASLKPVKELAAKKGRKLRVSFFSARKDAAVRNEAVLKGIEVEKGKTAWDLAEGRMFSDDKMEKMEDTDRRLKDVRKLLPGVDPDHIVYFDDRTKYVPDELQEALIWAYHTDRNTRIAHARGILEAALDGWEKGQDVKSFKEALVNVQWRKKDGKVVFRDTYKKDPEILKQGKAILEGVNRKVFKGIDKPDWDDEIGPDIKEPGERREKELEEASKKKTYYSGYSWTSPSSSSSFGSVGHGEMDGLVFEQVAKTVNEILSRYPAKDHHFIFRGTPSLYVGVAFDALFPGQMSLLPIVDYKGSLNKNAKPTIQKSYLKELEKYWPTAKELNGKKIVVVDYREKGEGMVAFMDDLEAFLKFKKVKTPVKFFSIVDHDKKIDETLAKEMGSKRLSLIHLYTSMALANKMRLGSSNFRPRRDYDPWKETITSSQVLEDREAYLRMKETVLKKYGKSPELLEKLKKVAPQVAGMFTQEKKCKGIIGGLINYIGF